MNSNSYPHPVQLMPEAQVAQQQAAYTALLQSLGQATFSEIETALAEREQVKPEKGLTPEIVNALKSRVNAYKAGE